MNMKSIPPTIETTRADYGLCSPEQVIRNLFVQCQDTAPDSLLEWFEDGDISIESDLLDLGDFVGALGCEAKCSGATVPEAGSLLIAMSVSLKTLAGLQSVIGEAKTILKRRRAAQANGV
jgi:hypothetical protein